MTPRRSVFAKAPVHAPAAVHEPLQLLAIRLTRALLRALPAPWTAGKGPLGHFAERMELAELWRTDLLEWRVRQGRAMGMQIGEGCRLFSLQVASEAELVELGDEVIMSGDVVLVTHDGAIFTGRERIPNLNGHYGRIRIGDRCFIGMRAIILPGVELGPRCIVAAGAVVMDSFPADSVIAGNPAEYVCSTSLYLKMKGHSAGTICDPEYRFPLKYPPEELARRMSVVPFRPVSRRHGARKDPDRAAARPLSLRS